MEAVGGDHEGNAAAADHRRTRPREPPLLINDHTASATNRANNH